MKNISAILSIIILGYLAHMVFPWWIIWLVCALVCYFFKQPALKSLLIGFFGSFLLWFVVSFWLNHGNDGLLSAKIGSLFGSISGGGLMVISSLIGGIIGGLGGLTGSLGRKMIQSS